MTQKGFIKLAKYKGWTPKEKYRTLYGILDNSKLRQTVTLTFIEDEKFTCECSPSNALKILKEFKQEFEQRG